MSVLGFVDSTQMLQRNRTSRLPVLYVFGKKPIDPEDCAEKFLQAAGSDALKGSVELRLDVAYCRKAGTALCTTGTRRTLTTSTDAILERLRTALPDPAKILYSPIPTSSHPSKQLDSPNQVPVDDDEHGIDPEDAVILYVGGESLSLTNLLMTHASCQVSLFMLSPSSEL